MKRLEDKTRRKLRRKARIRGTITGTAERPRMSVFKSNRYLSVQVIDDAKGHTLTAITNTMGELKALKSTKKDAETLGQELGKKMVALNIKEAVFDRNGNLFHGVIKAFADGVRKAGVRM